MSQLKFRGLLAGLFSSALFAATSVQAESPQVDYNHQIRPLLSNHCYACHGPDQKSREAGLRLDQKRGALGQTDSGATAIVPGHPEKSEVFRRITTGDAEERMPPVKHGKPLKPADIELIKQWIAEGAHWTEHWSFVSPVRPELPPVSRPEWCRNGVDRFVLARLEQEKLTPSPEADRRTLLRRVTLDLTGLPPTPAEVDSFLADTSPEAYEKVVDRLLASPRYGEHMARYWLDVARYGDTHGMHFDNIRAIWPYRDWVVSAFNGNMPFDKFTIEQLAGDMLPNATREQRVATGFVRCHVSTNEGGSILEEVQVRNTVDRAETTATAFLGLTAGCAVCHDHKYDPLTRKEFYQLYAFFNSTAEKPMDGNVADYAPVERMPTAAQRQQSDELETQITALKTKINEALAQVKPVDATPSATQPTRLADGTYEYVWIDDAVPDGARATAAGDPWKFVSEPKEHIFSGAKAMIRTARGQSQHYFESAEPGLTIGEGDKLFAYVYIDPKNPTREVMLQFNSGQWDHRAYWGGDLIDYGTAGTVSRLKQGPLPQSGRWVRLEVSAAAVGLKPGDVITGWAFTQFDGMVYWDRAGIVTREPQGQSAIDSPAAWERRERKRTNGNVPVDVQAALKLEPQKRTSADQKVLQDYYYRYVSASTRKTFEPLNKQLIELEGKRTSLEKSWPATLVMQELPAPQDAFDLDRGQYDKHGDKVARGVPAFLPPLPPHEAAPNRLTLARWLVDPNHPLTARVAVNRFWQQYFGVGIVKTAEDFGSQGDPPSHPQLLDYLATEFVRTGWDVKGLQKVIVMSATYRQSSAVTPQMHERDPENRLLARGPRFRLDGEAVRDTMLSISGLLVDKIGGPPVKPYQPDGLWQAVAYTASNTRVYQRDSGEALYRRSLYTFWKRTAPNPEMVTFDAPSREACVARRPRTNTPLQALVLLNDTPFIEAARHLAERMVNEGGPEPAGRAARGFLLATSRSPTAQESAVLLRVYQQQLSEFRAAPAAAKALLANGESPANKKLDPVELAAWTMTANLILNLDETITKE